MPQSLASVLIHLVFSTEGRRASISEEIAPSLYGYLATVVRTTGCECMRVGGVADHVHLAVLLGRQTTIAGLVEEVKTTSSKWMKAHDARHNEFAWQKGYGAFSVSASQSDDLMRYIDSQEEHHRKRDFQAEYRALLRLYGISFDEQYVWG